MQFWVLVRCQPSFPSPLPGTRLVALSAFPPFSDLNAVANAEHEGHSVSRGASAPFEIDLELYWLETHSCGLYLLEEFLAGPVLVASRQTLAHACGGFLETVVATYNPSGMYRRTISGIFFSRSSLIAICNGSVSPSKSTRTGAFMLQDC